MKKALIIIALSMLLISCALEQESEPMPITENISNEQNKYILFSSGQLGVEFQYPASWREPIVEKKALLIPFVDCEAQCPGIFMFVSSEDKNYFENVNENQPIIHEGDLLISRKSLDPNAEEQRILKIHGKGMKLYFFLFTPYKNQNLQQVDEALDKIINTFKEIPIEEEKLIKIPENMKEYSFDACGPLEKYKSQPFFQKFLQKITSTNYHDGIYSKFRGRGEEKFVEEAIGEVCYSKDARILIGIAGGGYGETGRVLKYNIQNFELTFANDDLVSANRRGFPITLSDFGKRKGSFIEMRGNTGDGGGFIIGTYHYYYDPNILELIRVCDNYVGGEIEFSDKATNCKDY